jgi:predicted nucleic acid-binding protein
MRGVCGRSGASGPSVMVRLIDTDILIDHLRGRAESSEFLTACLAAEDHLLCSVVTCAELFAGMRAGEDSAIRALLSVFGVVPIDATIAEAAGAYRRDLGKSHGVMLPDALLAATAKTKGATLMTKNTKHYPMSDLSIERPY